MYSIKVAKMQSKSIASIKICHKDYIIIYIVGVHRRNHTFFTKSIFKHNRTIGTGKSIHCTSPDVVSLKKIRKITNNRINNSNIYFISLF